MNSRMPQQYLTGMFEEFDRRDLEALRQVIQSKKREIDPAILDLAQIRLCKASNLGERLLLELPFLTEPGHIEANQPADIHDSSSRNS